LAIEEPEGVTTIEVRAAGITVTVVAPDTPAWFAVTLALPTLVPVTRPPGLTVAKPGGAEAQLAERVRS
jgi:hypothetical protein